MCLFSLTCLLSVGFLPCLCILADCVLLFVGCYHCSYYFVCLTFNVLIPFQWGILSKVSSEQFFAVSLRNVPMSPMEFPEFHLLSRYFSMICPPDLLASARQSPDQSDSHISLKYLRYLLVYFQHCSPFLPVGSL